MERALISSIVLVALGALSGCSESKPVAAAATAAPTTQTEAPPPADTAFVASGPLVVENQVDVTARREGVVMKTLVEPGARVKAGDLLASLDDRQVASEREAAVARTRSVEYNIRNWESEAKVFQADYERAQKMWDAQLITKEQLDHARYKLEQDEWEIKREYELLKQSKAQEQALDLELDKTRIRAPFAGLVARRYVGVGQRVAVGDRLFWVTATAPLRVRFTLPERFLRRVQKGQEFVLVSPDRPEEKHKARVIGFSPVVDPSSGTIEVLAEVIGETGELRPGMMTSIRIDQAQ
ncbi:MAG: efflux RND transporter periplasmic adaptor subunit [Terriglobales bacterium]